MLIKVLLQPELNFRCINNIWRKVVRRLMLGMKNIGFRWFQARQRQMRWGYILMSLGLSCWIILGGGLTVAQSNNINIESPPKIVSIAQANVVAKSVPEAKTAPDISLEDLKYPPKSKDPIQVSIGLHVTNLADINQASETFGVAGYLLYSWHDARLAFKPKPNGHDTRTASLDDIWHPALEMVNFKESSLSETAATIFPDGTIQAQERFSKTLSSGLALQNFPFDQQSLQIVLESLNYGNKIVELVADSPKITIGKDSFVSLSEWQIGNIRGTKSKSYFPPENQHYSRVTIDIHVKRNSGFYVFKVIVPLLLITIASWSVFWVDPQEFSTQIGIAFTNLLTVVALLLVISDSLPRVGYLTLMDGFTMLCFLTILVAILELVFAHRLEIHESHSRAQKLHNQARWIVPSGFFLCNLMLIGVMTLVK
jgi:hypothetical protein